MKAAIIAGHRGPGTGACGYIDEGAETIILRDMIVENLKGKGISAYTDVEQESLSTVVKKLDIFLSDKDICLDLHFNSFVNEKAHGTEVLIPNKYTAEEKVIAQNLLSAVCNALGTSSRGIKTESNSQHRSLAMLSGFNAKNLLLEVCFVSNKADSDLYLKNKQQLAKAIADVIIQSLK